jgi:2-(1,2-epoxy-1,2-dihydrophenyl)acetyl-CoA isomerase
MPYETILYDVADGIATITLNRPDTLNAFNRQMTSDLQAALKEAERDKAVRCLVLTGAGRAFSSGEDLKARQAEQNTTFGGTLRERYNPIIRRMREMEKPIIGAINGTAAGAGMSVALACDLRLASDKAKFIEVFVRVGLVPDSGSSFMLPWLVGIGKAMELCLLGDEVLAEDALRIGLVNRVVPADELMAATQAWAARLAQGPGKAYALIKRQLNRALASDLDSMLEYEVYQQEIAGRTADYAEALAAFVAKRPAVFKGE